MRRAASREDEVSDQTIQWAALYRLPTGEQIEDIEDRRFPAENNAAGIDRRFGAGTARVMYRAVTYGPWQDQTPGEEWAVEHRWPDGHVEVRPTVDHYRAEEVVMFHRAGRGPKSTARVVSRTVTYGQWWLADAAVTA